MGRLIDADALIKEIESQIEVVMEDESAAAHMTKVVADQTCHLINRIPTAYNVEKVVEQLEECKEDLADYIDEDIYLGQYRAYKNVIEIVKKGGLE